MKSQSKQYRLLSVLLATLFLGITTNLSAAPQESDAEEKAAVEKVKKTADEDAKKAEGEEESGLDKKIDKAFKPIAKFWGGLVFTPIKFGSTEKFQTADKSGDGNFDAEEYAAFSEGAEDAKPFAELDADKDGLLSPAESEQRIELPIVIIILVGGAAFFTIVFGFINLRLIPFAIKVVSGKYDDIEKDSASSEPPTTPAVNTVDGDLVDTIRDEGEGEVTHFQALATAVSGTVGLGNIAGVAVAIATGGPGATFWMIICGLLGMSTKFVECTLGVKYRDVDSEGTVYGGPMYYLSKGFTDIGLSPVGKVFGVVFAILCIGGSFGGGNAFQSNQAAAQVISLCGFEHGSAGTIIGLVMAVLVGIVIIGGIKRIAKVTEKIVPFMAIIYIAAALIIILMNIVDVPKAIGQIVGGAFTPAAGLGGLLGVCLLYTSPSPRDRTRSRMPSSA